MKYAFNALLGATLCFFAANSFAVTGITLELSTDRPGSDYKSFFLALQAPASQCMDRCSQESRCVAYTMVRAGVQGTKPRCWLKESAGTSIRRNGACTSGYKY